MKSDTKKEMIFGPRSIVVATFGRGVHDNFARIFEGHGLLAFCAMATRRGTHGVPPERTRLKPVFGFLNYLGGRFLPPLQAETLRFRLYPFFDRWVRSQLSPGQHLLTSYAFVNASMKWAREHGGATFLDAGNSHPRSFWNLLSAEQKKWESPHPPVAPFYNRRCQQSVDFSDYVFAQSPFVRDSFLEQGWDGNRVCLYGLPLSVDWFKPAAGPRPASRPLTLLNTGALCLRKGTPYLLEAFRLIRQREPSAVLRLAQTVRPDVQRILAQNADLPIEWCPHLRLSVEADRKLYLERFQTSDLFVFPTLEEGFSVVVKEAIACGLPVITTKNSGASDVIQSGINGELVPIRDPAATAEAVLKWWAIIRGGQIPPGLRQPPASLSFETFDRSVVDRLAQWGTLPGRKT
jgi:glycosyltransferase involved in cell wall biosynthesis